MITRDSIFMVFDVESVGLHGEGFAVGFVVVNGYGEEIQHGLIACNPDVADGDGEGRDWVARNVPSFRATHSVAWPHEVRNVFWDEWLQWKERGALMVADCAWPVETGFLAECVDDNPDRTWKGPYPLHDLASIVLAQGGDPLKTNDRLPNELPAHNPLNDARQSARLLIKALFEV